MSFLLNRSLRGVCAAAIALALISTPAFAISRIISPNVHKGELELEYQGSTTFDDDRTKDNNQAHKMEVEYGLTDRMKVELEGKFTKAPDESLKLDEIEAASVFQFFEQGEYWLDSGLQLAYAHALKDGNADVVEAKLLLEKGYGKFLHRLNLVAEHEVGADSADGFERSALWGSRYRYNKYVEPGVEWQSDFGRASDHHSFNEQSHFVGPALYGELAPGVKYEAAYLVGVSDAAEDGAARLFLEYELYF